MKKSVVILIGIIYLVSVALVSFFGLDFKVFEEVVYVERVEILNKGTEEFGGIPCVYVKAGADGIYRYQIEYRVYPDNATNQEVDFIYDKQNTAVSIDEKGVVTLTSPTLIEVEIIPRDGSVASASIIIIAI